MRRFLFPAAALLLLLLPALAVSGPVQPAERKALPDTAGNSLMRVWKAARRKYPDALLYTITGKTDASGIPKCSRHAPFQKGWRYSFYSPKAKAFVMMAECAGAVAGPLRQLRTRDELKEELLVQGHFIDSPAALRALAVDGVSLDPRKHGGRGIRPFSLKLEKLEDDRFKEKRPTVWRIRIGKKTFLVDAYYNERLSPKRYHVALSQSSSTLNTDSLKMRPKHTRVYSAKKDIDRVMKYARKSFPGAELMAIEGFSDAWGGSPCTGPGDGWAYYFYLRRKDQFEVLFACNGNIGPGPTQYIPVNPKLHAKLEEPFVDSTDVADILISERPDCMNETLGRTYTRHGVLLLVNYKKPPLEESGIWEVKEFWQMTLGKTSYLFDARKGTFLGLRE